MKPSNPPIRFTACLLLMAGLPGCGDPSPAEVADEAERLRASFGPHRAGYLQSLDTVNRLIPDTLRWLDGAAITAPRAQAVADAHMIMERWAQVHFVPRTIHEKLRSNRYRAKQVSNTHRRLLDLLKRDYFEWHDYQRYAQRAAESSMHNTPPGRLPPELEQFRRRLRTRPPVDDPISPLLDELPPSLPKQDQIESSSRRSAHPGRRPGGHHRSWTISGPRSRSPIQRLSPAEFETAAW